jgi:rhodanese-related sulfurtransferase
VTVQSKKIHISILLIIIIGAALPILHYWYSVGSVAGVSAREVGEILSARESSAVLVDVRGRKDFAIRHIADAHNWTYEEIRSLESGDMAPDIVKGKKVFLISESGILSARAAQKLRDDFNIQAYSVRDGIGGWIAENGPQGGQSASLRTVTGEKGLPFKKSHPHEQWALVFTGFTVKPIYMLLSGVLIVFLLQRRSADLVALRWALISFLASEAFCAINYMVFSHRSHLSEFLHGYGMVLSFGFISYGLLEGVDQRVFKYSDPDKKCAAVSLCKHCSKYVEVSCGVKRWFYFLIVSTMILAFMPFSAPLQLISYNTQIFGTFYNHSHPVIYQIFEVRYCPIYAILMFTISCLVLLMKRENAVGISKIFFAAGLGPFGFGFLRLILLHAYRENLVWFNFWEELTELIFVVGIGLTLWLFRHNLFNSDLVSGSKEKVAEPLEYR